MFSPVEHLLCTPNPTYLSDTDQEQARQEIHGVSETVSTLTWSRIPTTKKTHREAAQ